MVIDLGILSIKVDVLIIQIINIFLLLWIIRKAFGDTIVEQIAHFRETRLQLSNADKMLKENIEKAQLIKEEIVNEGLSQKKEIIQSAQVLASLKEKEIIEQAENTAKSIITQAEAKTRQMEIELKDSYLHMVKSSAWTMVKKIFENDPIAQDTYIKKVINDGIVQI